MPTIPETPAPDPRYPADIIAGTLVAQFGFTAKTARIIAEVICVELDEQHILVAPVSAVADLAGQFIDEALGGGH